jgi:hypothetical protein
VWRERPNDTCLKIVKSDRIVINNNHLASLVYTRGTLYKKYPKELFFRECKEDLGGIDGTACETTLSFKTSIAEAVDSEKIGCLSKTFSTDLFDLQHKWKAEKTDIKSSSQFF